MEKIAHFCQSCRAANEPGEISCRECGTPLMIVTLPPSSRHEEEIIPSYYEDHLLERVTLLELKLAQVTEQLAMAYEFISRQTESFQKDHLVIRSFMDSIKEVNPKLADSLALKFTETYEYKKEIADEESERQKLLTRIFSYHENSNMELFSHLVEEGIKLLTENEEKQGFRTLERAALLSPSNTPLHLFIAENLFKADKFELAKTYLKKVFELSPQNSNAQLLLGVIYADEAKAEQSRRFLSILAGVPEKITCANYVWGILAAYEKKWKEALVAFKECLEKSPKSEIFYLIGCCYFQLQDFNSSIIYFEKAIENDYGFADAWFMKSIVYTKLDQIEKAEKSKYIAFDSRETGAKCLRFYKEIDLRQIKVALPFIHFEEKNKRLLTNASVRLSKFFRQEILNF